MPPSSSTTAAKPSKSLTVVLRLPAETLSRFPSDVSATSTPPSNGVDQNSPPSTNPSSETVGASAGRSQQPNSSLLVPPQNPMRRKGIPGPKPGMKRNASQLSIDGVPKPRGKPGPKKKIRIDGDGNPTPAPKLGPKANQGAINAGLRALDRTGKPCRRWQRTPFMLKSFTGILWDCPSWATNKRHLVDPSTDGKSETAGSSDGAKPAGTVDSSALPSEKSNNGSSGDTPMPTIIETPSSPVILATNGLSVAEVAS